jgi:lipoate-protein ligase B
MTRPTFEELRETLAMTNEGRVLDSFIAVEIGLSDYEACWDAHNDVYEQLSMESNEETIITLFLTEVYDMLDVEEDSFERVLGASL